MELIEGGTIASKILDQNISLATKLNWLKQTLGALHYLHDIERILHRDIKPQNILLTGGNKQRIKLIDLGLATIVTTSGANSKVGTTPYSSYEKSHGFKYDGRDDVWAVGCVFSELITNKSLDKRGGTINDARVQECVERKNNLIEECVGKDRLMGEAIRSMLEIYENRKTAKEVLEMLEPVESSLKVSI